MRGNFGQGPPGFFKCAKVKKCWFFGSFFESFGQGLGRGLGEFRQVDYRFKICATSRCGSGWPHLPARPRGGHFAGLSLPRTTPVEPGGTTDAHEHSRAAAGTSLSSCAAGPSCASCLQAGRTGEPGHGRPRGSRRACPIAVDAISTRDQAKRRGRNQRISHLCPV